MGWWKNFWRGAPAAPVNVIKGRQYPAVDDPRWEWATDGAAIDELKVRRFRWDSGCYYSIWCEGVPLVQSDEAKPYVDGVLSFLAGKAERRAEATVDRITLAGIEKK